MVALFYGSVLGQTGGEKSFVPAGSASIRALVGELGCRYGGRFEEFLLSGDDCFFLVNGKSIAMSGGLETSLHPGDRIEVLPFVEAG